MNLLEFLNCVCDLQKLQNLQCGECSQLCV